MTTTRSTRPHRFPQLVPDPRSWRWPVIVGVSVAAVAGLFVVHVLVGRGALSAGDTVAALVGAAPSRVAQFVVVELRLPRALIAVTVGALMGLSGAILQSVLRNPLAEPGTLGITSGGVLASVVYLAVNPATYLTPSNRGVGQFGGFSLPVVTLCGGLATGALVYALSRGRRTDPLRLTGRRPRHRPWPAGRALPGAAGVLPNAVAISIVGAIGFVGLIGPNLARHLVGDDARRIFPLSAVVGAGLVLGADAVAGTVAVSGLELPVGAVMALTGGPFFLYLIARRIR